jgi:hypothetical protein
MKRIMLITLLCFLMSGLLVGWAWAQGDGESQTPVATQTGETTAEEQAAQGPVKPNVTWGDYKYTFNSIAPSSDLDPQSVIMNWFTPDLYNANWSAANYVHLYINIDWLTNDRSLDYMPLQLVLHSGGGSFILFGKGCSNSSYLWRRGNHYENDLGARYPDHVGDDARLFFTFDTNGAHIDPYSAYVEVKGMLEVWDWDMNSTLYTDEASYFHHWYRTGSTYFTYTHLANIPLTEILPAQ